MRYNLENRRYTGSKSKLSNWILEIINKKCDGEIFMDLFGGTGIIASKAIQHFKEVIINDFLDSNYVIYRAFFGMERWNSDKVENIVRTLNNRDYDEVEENYFSINFGNKYFGWADSKKIGNIREELESLKSSLNEKEYFILLASLLYSTDKIANTVGHYDAYRKVTPLDNRFKLGLIRPLPSNVLVYKEDSNQLVRRKKSDVVYIDPPYNSRQYGRFYHVLENLSNWNKPRLSGVALKPKPEKISTYCLKRAPEAFRDLIDNLGCKYIIVSYNNTYNSKSNSSKNKISLEQIKSILDTKGKTTILEKGHKYFNAGKTSFDDHREYLFVTEVKYEEI